MLENFQTVLMWVGGFTLFCMALLPVIVIFTAPRLDDDSEAHGDTTGYDRTGKDHRP